MSARLRWLLALIAVLLRDAIGVGLMLVTALLGWLLFTESGAVLGLRTVERAVGGLAFEQVEGRLWGELRVQQLRYEDAQVLVVAEALDLHWSPLSLLSRQLSIAQLHVAQLDVQLKPQPEVPPEPDSTVLSEPPLDVLLGDIAVDRLRVRLPEAEPITLQQVTLSADWRGPQIELRRLAAVTPWAGALTLQGRVRLGAAAAEIETLRATEGFAAHLQGRLGYGTTPSDLQLSWTDLSWPPQSEPQVQSASGTLHWTGLPDDYRYQLQAALAASGQALELDAQGTGTLSRLRADRIEIAALNGRIAAHADIDWRDGLRINAEGQIQALDPAALHTELSGLLNGRFKAETQIQQGVPRVDFELALSDSELRGYPLQLDSAGRYDGETVALTRLELRSGSTRMSAQGQVWPQLDTRLRLDSPDLAALWPDLGGRADLKLSARGDYATPRLDLQAQLAQLRYGELRLAQAQLKAQIDLAHHLALDLTAEGLVAGAEIRSLRLGVHGPLTAHRIVLSADAAQGDFGLTAEGRLDPQAPSWRGRLVEARLAPQRLAAWTLETPTTLSLGPGLDLAPACWTSGAARACLRVLRQGPAQRVALRLEAFELGSLAPLLPTGTKLQAVLDGSGDILLDETGLRELQAELRSSAGQWQQPGLPPLRWGAAQARADESGRGTEIQLRLPLESGEITLDALLAGRGELMQRAVSGRLRVALPKLDFLRALSPEVQSIEGRLDGDGTLAGTLAQLQPQGALVLSGGRLRLATPGIELRELQARIDADGATPLRVSARARADEGELYIGGEVDPWNAPLRLDLKLSGYNAQVVRTPEIKVWVSPNLTIKLAQQQLRVTGTVEVPRADIAPKSLNSGIGPSADQVIVVDESGPEVAGLGIFADIGLRLGDAVRFEGFGLKTRLAGNLQLRETPGVPTSGRGEINLIEGRYKAYGQDLNLETGRLLFTGGAVTSPAVELRATRQPRPDISVGVLVRGTLEKPQLSLFSTPTMAQQQQLSWLILGRDLEQSTGTEDREMLAGAALSMGLAGGEWLAQRFGGAIGIDEIALGARPGETAEQAQLTVGKYLRPGLFISYGIGLFQPGHSFKLEYDIGRGFKLATESGVESGGDVLYTIEPEARIRTPSAPARDSAISGQ